MEPTSFIAMRMVLDRDAVEAGTSGLAHAVIELVPQGQVRESAAPPLSVVFVLDLSGSMKGPPLEHVKGSVSMLVNLLGTGNERIGVVGFADEAVEIAPLQPLDAAWKQAVTQRVRKLQASGSTNVSAGLERARAMLGERALHERQLIVVLSDGQPNRGIANLEGLRALVSAMRPGVTTVALGYGAHHDEDILAGIADAGGGEYFFIADPLEADEAFARAVGAQRDVVADSISVTLSPESNVDIDELVTRVPSKIGREGLVLTLPDMFAGKARYIVVRLSLAAPRLAGTWPALTATLRYRSAGLAEVRAVAQTLEIPVKRAPGALVPDAYSRVLLAEAELARAEARAQADRGQYAGAAAVIRAMIEKFEACPWYRAGDGSVLADAFEQLHDERIAYERVPSAEEYRNFKRMSLGVAMQDGGWHHSDRALEGAEAKRIAGGAAGNLPKAFLMVRLPNGQETRMPLHHDAMIGRVAGNYVVVPSGNVSKRHTRVAGRDGKYLVMDLGSTNGTYVNGHRLYTPQVLKPGDEIQVGDAVLRYEEE